MVATQFGHNSFLYSKYIIRKGNGTFVSSENLKLQSFFILIPDGEEPSGPPKPISFLYIPTIPNLRKTGTPSDSQPMAFLFFVSARHLRKRALY